MIHDNKPVYIIKEEDKYEIANKAYERKIKKEYKIKKIEKPENYFTYNAKNKNDETILKIVIYDNKKEKNTTNTCQSSNQKSKTENTIKLFRENKPELYDKYESFFKSKKKKEIVCNAIELILRKLETDKMMYHINYDYYELVKK